MKFTYIIELDLPEDYLAQDLSFLKKLLKRVLLDRIPAKRVRIGKAQALAQGKAIQTVLDEVRESSLIVVDGVEPPAIQNREVKEVILVPKADALIPAVSLASIFAKTAQIRFMQEQEGNFPEYGFASHCGYGTKAHKTALNKLGPCPIHRMSYGPIRKAVAQKERENLFKILGDLAEDDS
jgi:ribonuclease HII